ncbi:hypothetical protein GOBAR_DD12720 [Gossypium barbadense]|nr:hypothetical protein GOBAR_DD12720 [Gossypium barbadense]
MTEVLLSPLVGTILDGLKSWSLKELELAGSLKTEVASLESTLTTIQAVLQDAEEKQWKSEAIKNWLVKLKQAAYDLEAVLEDFNTEALSRSLHTDARSQVTTFFSLRNPLSFRLDVARKFKNVREKLDAIAGEKSKFHLREGVGEAEIERNEDRQTSSLVKESEVLGRADEKEKIVSMLLCNESHHDDLSVYAICGMGGLGKTTIAQLVFNDENVAKVFDLRGWVCVSDDFDIKRLTKAIVESFGGNSCGIQELDTLQRCLAEKLLGKRFLLVLDDVWNEYHDKWDRLKQALQCGWKGSTVIVTTRLENVALMMATTPFYRLGCLSDDDSWSLFKQRAFGMGMNGSNANLETIGRRIVQRCGGVPLAIKAIGSILRFRSQESEWLRVKDSEIWDLEDKGSRILAVLRLKIKEDVDGTVTCKMHDLIHDLATSIMGQECCVIEATEGSQIPKTARHLFVYNSSPSTNVMDFTTLQPLQSLILHGYDINFSNLSRYISKQKYLKVLDMGFNSSNIAFKSSKHLRYLCLHGSHVKTLPESTSFLHNLQTLNLGDCYNLQMLPKGTKNLKNLRYLDIRNCDALTSMPVALGQLSVLRKLSMFIVGKEDGCGIDELKGLALEGELSIKGLHNVKSSMEAKNANLIKKHNLRSLSLSWPVSSDLSWRVSCNESSRHQNDEEILSALQPHSNLKKLCIFDYQGLMFPYWMMDLLLPNLVEISLENCERCHQLPPLGKLRFLKVLNICRISALKYIDDTFYGDMESSFPSLEVLSIREALCLEEWTTVNGREHFPLLSSLTIESCPKLVKLPMIQSLKQLYIRGTNVTLLTPLIMNATVLTSLQISDFNELPDGLLQNQKQLDTLSVLSCSLKSSSDLLDNLSCLKYLNIQGCSIESLPAGLQNLSSLKSLDLDCDSLVSLPVNGLQGLCSLSSLYILSGNSLASLSEGLQYLTSLQDLFINGCPRLTSLPRSIQHLSSLRYLRIWNCRGLISLPDEIQHLTLLSLLDINGCSNLMSLPQGRMPPPERRCKKVRGEDWPNIVHIPSNDIFNQTSRILLCTVGSTVIVTTRLEKAALMMATTPFYRLGCLSDDDSWSLFKQRAFGMGMNGSNANLETTGRQLVQRCGVVPLAVKAIGSILRFRSQESEWLHVKDSEIWDLEDEGSRIIAVLRLSHEHLPPYMRQCFSFCSIFPKDSVMTKDKLLALWMANGFIPFFKKLKRMLMELLHPNEVSQIPKTAPHLFVYNYNISPSTNIMDLTTLQPLQSLILCGDGYFNHSNPSRFISKQKYLKVLHLGFYMSNIEFKISKQLRYLYLHNSTVKTLPESTSSLLNLQTLSLKDCGSLKMLPKGTKNLKNLRYLDIRGCHTLTSMPVALGQLSFLRKLSIFILGKKDGCGIDELKELALEGELSIKGLTNVKSAMEAKMANLIKKHNLRSLSLSWQGNRNENSHHQNDEEVLLCSLTSFNLEEVTHNWLPRISALKYIDDTFYGDMESSFPSLEVLSIRVALCLEEWTTVNGREHFPLLSSLTVDCCPKLVKLPMIQSLKELHIGETNVTLLTSLIMNATVLTSLRISDFNELPDELLKNQKQLDRLNVFYCSLKSSSDLLDNLSCLKYLDIQACSIESLPAGLQNLSSLETLDLNFCDSLVSLPGLRYLTSLQDLLINECPELTSLPRSIQHLSSLRYLQIRCCRGLISLPDEMQHLSLLSEFSIINCSNLMSLPQGVHNLTTLQALRIYGCPHLQRRCKKVRGEDWPNIAHIPFIEILN